MAPDRSTLQNQAHTFDQGIIKLGWLPPYARQIILCRYMLRAFSIFNDESLPVPEPELSFLAAHRLAITLLSGANRETRRFSASYSPNNRPDTHSLKYWRAGLIFDVSSASGAPTYGFHYANGGGVGFDHGDTKVLEDQLFVHEIFEVGKGVNLDSKDVADGRADELRTKALWRDLVSGDQKECLDTYNYFITFWPGAWEFWRNWYQGFLDGKPLDWELQRRVALIPDADWEKGPEHIARVIDGIRADYFTEKMPLAEKIEFDERTQKFSAKPLAIVAPDLLETNLQLVQDALEDAMGGNGLLSGCWEQKILTRTLTEYRDDPQRVEMDCMRVRGRVESKLGGELPESDELVALCDTLLTTALDIRAQHPEVADARAKRTVQTIREASPEDRQELANTIPVLREITDENLGNQLADDIEEIVEGTGPEIALDTPRSTDPVIRTGNRTAKMWMIAKKVGKGGALVAGGLAATAAGVVAVDQAIPVLAKVWPILARLLGL